jgi:hypothetical protein
MSPIQSGNDNLQKLEVDHYRVLGAQDGVPERALKLALAALFQKHLEIKAAYLVRVDFGESTPEGVALCLVSTNGPNEELAQQIGDVFASVFSRAVHMDIVFLQRTQESQVSGVCHPFFFSDQV